jgi:sec-independent protein translocase protein TatA
MLGNLSGWHFLIILFIILLLFGAPKLPALAKSLGESMKIMKKEVREAADDDASERDTKTASDSSHKTNLQQPSDSSNDAQQDSGSIAAPKRDGENS